MGRDATLQESVESTKQDEGSGRVSRPIPTLQDVALPEGIRLIEAEPIVDRRSVFVGRACQISHPSQVRHALFFAAAGSRRVLMVFSCSRFR